MELLHRPFVQSPVALCSPDFGNAAGVAPGPKLSCSGQARPVSTAIARVSCSHDVALYTFRSSGSGDGLQWGRGWRYTYGRCRSIQQAQTLCKAGSPACVLLYTVRTARRVHCGTAVFSNESLTFLSLRRQPSAAWSKHLRELYSTSAEQQTVTDSKPIVHVTNSGLLPFLESVTHHIVFLIDS